MNYKKTLIPIEQQFNGNFTSIVFNSALNRASFTPVVNFMDTTLTGLGISNSDLIRFISVAADHAPNFYSVGKANCMVAMFTTGNDVVSRDIAVTDPYSISVTYLTGNTHSITTSATKADWIDYINDSLLECKAIYSKLIRNAQFEKDVNDFIANTNKTIVDSFVTPSKEKAFLNPSLEVARESLVEKFSNTTDSTEL